MSVVLAKIEVEEVEGELVLVCLNSVIVRRVQYMSNVCYHFP
jgi:hypothetical protein